jgi:hypothetical protein
MNHSKTKLSPELQALLDSTRPLADLDLKGLKRSIRELNKHPDHIADVCKGAFVEDVLRALDENEVPKSELARRLGKTRQQLSCMLNEEKLNNFTIETMAQISTALGRKLFVRMLAAGEYIQIQKNISAQTTWTVRQRSLFSKEWSGPTPHLKPADLKKAKQAVHSLQETPENLIPFNNQAA